MNRKGMFGVLVMMTVASLAQAQTSSTTNSLYVVGGCRPSAPSFPTINSALAVTRPIFSTK